MDTHYPFHTLVYQGKIERVFLDEIERAGVAFTVRGLLLAQELLY